MSQTKKALREALTDAQIETLIENSGGFWREDMFVIEGSELTAMLQAAAALSLPETVGEPVAWREHVEQRLQSWRQRFINETGDQLSLRCFMDKESVDDLIDYVCSEYAAPPSQPAQGEPVDVDELIAHMERVCADDCSYRDSAILAALRQHKAMLAAAPAAPIAESVGVALETVGWTAEDALKFYASGKHFDVVNGRARVLDTGAIASDALKGMSAGYAEAKGAPAGPPSQERSHVWDRGGERCIVCGAKDWMAGACSGPTQAKPTNGEGA